MRIYSAFESSLLAAIPKARLYARSLARNNHDADDIVQQSLLRAIERENQFQLGTNIEAWLITIVRNAFYDKQKSHSVSRTDSLEDMGPDFDIPVPGEQMETVELFEVKEFINDLPEQERAVISMYVEGMKYKEIADALGLTRGNAMVVLCRTRKKLYEAFPER